MSVADELQKLVALRDAGALTAEEFDEQKRLALAGAAAIPEKGEEPQKMSGSGLAFMTALVVFALAVTTYWVQNPSAEDKAAGEDSLLIKACWKEYERKSLSPQQKLDTARTCERMESDFRKRYGRNP